LLAGRIESYSFPPRSSPLTFQRNAVICYAAMESVASAIALHERAANGAAIRRDGTLEPPRF